MQTKNLKTDTTHSWPSKETSAAAILERAEAKCLLPQEFDKQFGDLPTDGEG